MSMNMNTYKDYSRKALINMATGFDAANDDALKNFVDETESQNPGCYELITPAEIVFENLEERKEILTDAVRRRAENAADCIDSVLDAAIDFFRNPSSEESAGLGRFVPESCTDESEPCTEGEAE